ncbi:MAG: helix-turn-helix domain-containing protein [Xanthobacteraceae bacterium]
MPTKSGWHRADIIAAIHKKGSSLRRLGRDHGLAESTLSAALSQPRTPSNRIIANFLGQPLHALWPQWFRADDALLTSPTKAARRGVRPSSQKRRAA